MNKISVLKMLRCIVFAGRVFVRSNAGTRERFIRRSGRYSIS
ncbi:Uncharacterized protein dnm_063260 [Desulfonema magnum]|uniref:Uncharacterized protein n=1 Tax=Desulfonema magnum TaxID=45655 RepID=A0A975BSI3_9BACT|nr:Uncharacterized protein dnm_063260 [Desulfonema magnum]